MTRRRARGRRALPTAATMITVAALASASARAARDERAVIEGATHERAFRRFLDKYGKKYCDASSSARACGASLRRQRIYFANMAAYDAHNAEGSSEYVKGETRFSDLTAEEFASTWLTYTPVKSMAEAKARYAAMTGAKVASELGTAEEKEAALGTASVKAKRQRRAEARQRARDATTDDESKNSGTLGNDISGPPKGYPKEFSWRSPPAGYGNVVGLVHDQQDMCASCWAFVTADSIASRIAVVNKGDDAPRLSVKQLMACDDIDHACSTGNMYTAYEWLGQNGGISTEEDYNKKVPGEREDDPAAQCALSAKKMYNTPGMCDLEQILGEEPLYRALYERGPVAVGINANELQAYTNGVIMLDDCHPLGRGIESINHAALVVGWGETSAGVKFWELKNSYGPEWGDQGFFRIERGRIGAHGFGTCGLLFESVYPVVTKVGSPSSSDAPCTEGSVQKASYYRNETLNPGAGLGDESAYEESDDTVASRSTLGDAEGVKDCGDKNVTVKADTDADLGVGGDHPTVGVDVAPLKHLPPRHRAVFGVDIPSFSHIRAESRARAHLGSAAGTKSSPTSITLLAPIGALIAFVGVAAQRRRITSPSKASALLAERFAIDETTSLV